ncbi:UDPglucose 6-dehydrogenase [Saccharopolyspora kobensis]|uniref:UDP-glucose 6-dehydrogenase n=1 Tax=Saccharopolyspora kobensis TaxID=146035 RepID=A0A1H6AFQ3_9PSEU|nr:UDP-glucose/GDP-mannose dehydrogenase family protein [Saccharopolyspora kobensis]SEG46586.1 UDPglucose 6-dehydrogenase [Saccharopolyspora kobensis]SFE54828.1 UDP-glucose dehydrogenase [Saccharopolyspora kobensis]
MAQRSETPTTRRVAVVGTGYVGLTTGACLASLGHHVQCCDVDRTKVERLSRGEVRIHEPGLGQLVRDGIRSGRLEFTHSSTAAVRRAEAIFLCVPTPMAPDGSANLAQVESAVREVRDHLPADSLLVTKSTVPVGTAARLSELLDRRDVAVVSNPEFLREGLAVRDFLNPDRIVVGTASAAAARRVSELYARLEAPTVHTDSASAELIKYAANCFLATKLSYVNDLAELCERVGADIGGITECMAHDHRIANSFLRPGPGWGGSCLPKDTAALLHAAEAIGADLPLVRAAVEANRRHQRRVVDKVVAMCGGSVTGVRVGMLGLAFKAGTDDLRDSPAIAVARRLAELGANLIAFDPALRGDEPGIPAGVSLADSAYQVAKGAGAVLVLTDWPEFRDLDWPQMVGLAEKPVIIDTRNLVDPRVLERAGAVFCGTGRAPNRDSGEL